MGRPPKHPITADSAFLGLGEVAAMLDIHRNTAYELVKRNEFPIPVVRIGRSYKLRKRDVDDFLAGTPRPADSRSGEGAAAGGEAAQAAPSPGAP